MPLSIFSLSRSIVNSGAVAFNPATEGVACASTDIAVAKVEGASTTILLHNSLKRTA
jgi:hypothetical protein